MNNVQLIGRLTKDVEIKYANEMAIARFTVAIDRPAKKDGTKEADFPRVVCFGKQAENCDKFLRKGKLVAVDGRIQTGSYENGDGNKVFTCDVVANRVEFLEWDKKKEEAPKAETSVPSQFEALDDDEIPF